MTKSLRTVAPKRRREHHRPCGFAADAPENTVSALCREPTLGVARELDCEFVHPEQSGVDGVFVERTHGAGIGVNAWTVTTRSSATRLREAGVEGVIADSASVVER